MLINEIFTSIDGEVNQYGQGCISTFIRCAQCNLSCSYCDAKYASQVNFEWTARKTANKIVEMGCPKITITGGEPLLQAQAVNNVIVIVKDKIPNAVFTVETNGTHEPFKIIPRLDYVSFIVDFKLPSARVNKPIIDFYKVYGELREIDWIKFVIADENDYSVAKRAVRNLFNYIPAKVAFSPVHDMFNPKLLVEKMIEDRLWNVNLNIQIHKIIGVS